MTKRLFIVITSVFTCACVLLFCIFYQEAKNAAIVKLHEEQMIHAMQAARGIEDFFAMWTRSLNSLAKMDPIIAIDATGKSFMDLYYKAHREEVLAITRLDEKGVIAYNYPQSGLIGTDISAQKHVQEMLRDRKPVISDVFRAVEGVDAIALHVPIFRGAVFYGTIGILVNFEDLARRYLDVIKIGKTGYGWVISRDGTQLYSPIPGFVGKSIFENIKGSPSLNGMVGDMLNGRTGAAAYTFDRIGALYVGHFKKYAVYMPVRIGNTFWSIAVTSGEQDVLSGLISFRNKLAFIIGIIFFCGIALLLLSLLKAMTDIAELKKARDEIKRSSAEIARANADLESFAHSVSHDLRAPLRAITGFGAVLEKACPEKLNEEEKGYLSEVIKGGQRMDALITDILALSRVSRQKMELKKTNFTEMARFILDGLQRSHAGRQVEISIQENMLAYADERLMNIALTNLFDNAWKYTGKTGRPKIEMASLEKDGQTVFLIRDNGTGFDATQTERLFKPFQRFHPESQFPGTGIGLSIVERVIRKHGGSIWAESEPGKGATFYFSMGGKKN